MIGSAPGASRSWQARPKLLQHPPAKAGSPPTKTSLPVTLASIPTKTPRAEPLLHPGACTQLQQRTGRFWSRWKSQGQRHTKGPPVPRSRPLACAHASKLHFQRWKTFYDNTNGAARRIKKDQVKENAQPCYPSKPRYDFYFNNTFFLLPSSFPRRSSPHSPVPSHHSLPSRASSPLPIRSIPRGGAEPQRGPGFGPQGWRQVPAASAPSYVGEAAGTAQPPDKTRPGRHG